MQLRHFVWVIQRWLWLILLGTLICSGATYLITKRTPPVYEASALIQVNDVGSTGNSSVFNNQALAVSYALQITSNDVFQKVSKELPGVTVNELQTAVSAAPLDNTQLIQVLADARDPVQAANIANSVTTVFIQQQIAKESAINQRAAARLLQELVTAKANVDNAQAQLTKLVNTQAPQNQITHQTDILDSYQVNYDTLFTSYNQIQLQENLISNSLSIPQSAMPPTTAKGHSTLLNTGIAGALGLLLTIVFALLIDWLDRTIKTSEDVAQLAMLEPLGSVPLSRSSANKAIVDDADLEQAFVTISTSFRVLSRGQRSILVTGLRSRVGTSTTASWLAQALAQSGMRVLLVDANLHRPTQHETFNFPNTTGVTNSLSNINRFQQQSLAFKQAWLKRWSTSVPNLFLLPAGPQVTHVETIQLTAKLQALAEWLLRHNDAPSSEMVSGDIDIIIFDAPALEEGATTIALAPVTDSTVLVIEAGKERPEALAKAQTTFQRLGSPIIGVVVNRQQTKHRTYFYANHPQQVAVSADSSHTSSASKYPVLQTRTIPFKELTETPLPAHDPVAIEAPYNDNTIRIPRAIMAISHAPDAAKVNVADAPDATLAYPAPSQTNGSRPSDNQGEQLR